MAGAPMRPGRAVRRLGLTAVLLGVPLALWAGWGTPAFWASPALAAAIGLSEYAVVRVNLGQQRWSLSSSDAAIAAAFVLAPGGWIVVAGALGTWAAQVARHQPRVKAEFSIQQVIAATAIATAVDAGVEQLGPGRVLAACGAMMAYWLVNHVLVALAVSFTSRRKRRTLLVNGVPVSLLQSFGSSSVGILAGWLSIEAPAGLLGLLVPIALLWSSYESQTRGAEEAKLFAELARGQERATGRSVDASAQVVLTAAARVFGGADVEMVLLGADGAVHYAGDEFGVPVRRNVEMGAFDEPWVVRALASGGVTTGVEHGRPWVAALLGTREAPVAVLVARRPLGAAAFGRREAMLATLLGGQAESWLSVANLTAARDAALDRISAHDDAARALGDLGADTAPALAVLRDSASRLLKLTEAAGRADDMQKIVEELHSVERAVASLLGAVAIAAEPELSMDQQPDEQPGRTAATSWTTTGTVR